MSFVKLLTLSKPDFLSLLLCTLFLGFSHRYWHEQSRFFSVKRKKDVASILPCITENDIGRALFCRLYEEENIDPEPWQRLPYDPQRGKTTGFHSPCTEGHPQRFRESSCASVRAPSPLSRLGPVPKRPRSCIAPRRVNSKHLHPETPAPQAVGCGRMVRIYTVKSLSGHHE